MEKGVALQEAADTQCSHQGSGRCERVLTMTATAQLQLKCHPSWWQQAPLK